MDALPVQERLDAIDGKLELILEEMQLQQRHRREMEDLKDDLMRVGKDLYQAAVVELEEVHDHLSTGDLLHLGKKLLRNVNNITTLFEQVENLKDFLIDFSPVSHELFHDLMHRLDAYDRKGYFEFMRELGKAMDNVVTSFTVEEVRNLSDNIVTILHTIKNLTQPDVLHAINNAVVVYKNLDIEVTEKVSIVSLLREANSPEFRRGMAFAIQFLKNVANRSTIPTTSNPLHTN